MKKLLYLIALVFTFNASAQTQWLGKFEQLDQMLPTPNEYRLGSGAPGPRYWQNKADYRIEIELNDVNQSVKGSEEITYYNNSPGDLKYLWLQLDQNVYQNNSNGQLSGTNDIKDSLSTKSLGSSLNLYGFDGGYKLESVKDMAGNPLSYHINQTMMRVDLSKSVKPGEKFTFQVSWQFNIVDRLKYWARSGFEFFPEDGNYIYHMAQFFPRMCVYDDIKGWQNKQYLGRAEFALPFGNYQVSITVPSDHIIAATGILQNPEQVLTKTQRDRFIQASKTYDKPVIIVTQSEAKEKEKTQAKDKKTWIFRADDVRDFAFSSSRKFIWDAMAVKVGSKTPMAMSFYPKEGNPLWEQESTKAVKNTIVTYSKHTIDYPYPVAISVHAPDIGMEYPMICFNFGRPNKDGTYSENVKNGMIGVIIHEVGHNFFPMIINSDERECTWMDEGLNTFVQYLTEKENYPGFPSPRGPAEKLVKYMKGDKTLHRPLMTGGEQIILGGAEQYGKAATALNILRETVMGPELFDKAFSEYADRWAFKHPKPSDFFRTMEDASGVDLDWFWRGWFYTLDNVDISVDEVKWYKAKKTNIALENKSKNVQTGELASAKNSKVAKDFSGGPTPLTVINTPDEFYGEFKGRIDDNAIRVQLENKNLYEVTLSNKGGLVMPVILQFIYKDGSKEIVRLPAEIWRRDETKIKKAFLREKEVVSVILDPLLETTDVNTDNNAFPSVKEDSKFDEFKKKGN